MPSYFIFQKTGIATGAAERECTGHAAFRHAPGPREESTCTLALFGAKSRHINPARTMPSSFDPLLGIEFLGPSLDTFVAHRPNGNGHGVDGLRHESMVPKQSHDTGQRFGAVAANHGGMTASTEFHKLPRRALDSGLRTMHSISFCRSVGKNRSATARKYRKKARHSARFPSFPPSIRPRVARGIGVR